VIRKQAGAGHRAGGLRTAMTTTATGTRRNLSVDFARQVAEEAAGFVHTRQAERLVVAAQKRMLGFLRPELKRCLKEQVQVREFPKDVTKLNPTELHAYLADENLVPRRRSTTSST
jgi:protein required for attachment to host cells